MRAKALLGALIAAHLVPSVAAIGPLRRAVLPRLCGVSDRDHVALTFDDGPDLASTPQVLGVLAAHNVHATFFVLGPQLAAHPELGWRIVDDGHELAVHGWSHAPLLLRGPRATVTDLRRARDLVTSVGGQQPRYWRPPHGIPTGAVVATGTETPAAAPPSGVVFAATTVTWPIAPVFSAVFACVPL